MYIAPSIVRVPSDPEMYIAETVKGRTGATLADDVNHLNGYKFLRTNQVNFALKYTGGGSDDANPAVTDYRVRWEVSPLAQYVWVGFWYKAARGKGSTPSTVDLELFEYPSGTSASDQIQWDYLEGLAEDETVGATTFDEYFCQTGWSASGTSTEPRLLDVSDYQGTELEVVIETSDVRLYSVMISEVYLDIL